MKKGTPHIDYLPLIGCLILVIDPLLVFFPSVSGLHVIRTMAFPIDANQSHKCAPINRRYYHESH